MTKGVFINLLDGYIEQDDIFKIASTIIFICKVSKLIIKDIQSYCIINNCNLTGAMAYDFLVNIDSPITKINSKYHIVISNRIKNFDFIKHFEKL